MLQKMEVESKDRQAQAEKMYRKNLNEEGSKLYHAQMATKDAQRSLELCQRKLSSMSNSDEKALSRRLDKGLKKLNSVHLTSPTGKVRYEFAKTQPKPLSRLCQACAKLTPDEHSTLKLECGTCVKKEKKKIAKKKPAKKVMQKATKKVTKKVTEKKSVKKHGSKFLHSHEYGQRQLPGKKATNVKKDAKSSQPKAVARPNKAPAAPGAGNAGAKPAR